MESKNYDDYTKEELDFFRAWRQIFPKANDWWGVRIGNEDVYIPILAIKLNHLKNIIKHIENHPMFYPDHLAEQMRDAYKLKLANETTVGKILYGR